MQSIELMELYIDEHLAIIREESNGRIEEWVIKQHKQQFTTWLKDQNLSNGETIDDITISRLARGPLR
jgi:hypothetical protein